MQDRSENMGNGQQSRSAFDRTDNPYFYQHIYNSQTKMISLKDGEFWPHVHPACKAALLSAYGEQTLNNVKIQITLLDTSGFDVGVQSLPKAMLRELNGAIFLVSASPNDQGSKDTTSWCKKAHEALITHLFPIEDRLDNVDWKYYFTTSLAGTKSDLSFNSPGYEQYCKNLQGDGGNFTSTKSKQAEILIAYWKSVPSFGMTNFLEGCVDLIKQQRDNDVIFHSDLGTKAEAELNSSTFPLTSCLNRSSVVNVVHKMVASILYKMFVIHTNVRPIATDSRENFTYSSQDNNPLAQAGVSQRKSPPLNVTTKGSYPSSATRKGFKVQNAKEGGPKRAVTVNDPADPDTTTTTTTTRGDHIGCCQ